jgi:hypothetical protein
VQRDWVRKTGRTRPIQAKTATVAPGLSGSPLMAPNFNSIATTLGMTDRALRVWLQSSHLTMPKVVPTRDEQGDVIAHIMSQQSGT